MSIPEDEIPEDEVPEGLPETGRPATAASAAATSRAGKADEDEDLKAPAEDAKTTDTAGDPRRVYHQKYASLDVEVRAAVASGGDGATMRAMAHDPIPRVISALMENPNFSVAEARVVAREHTSSVGLMMLVHNSRILADPEVRRRLLRNGHTSVQIIGTLLRGKPLLSIYQVGISHDVPENTKTFARSELRRAFGERGPEEKVGLILKTDGRILTLVTGIALDGRAISMIVGRTAMSPMLIRAFAQWPTTPPPILVHMMRLPQVQRDKSLQQAILRHPNVPSQYKRA
jgi:hypothetical protein